MIISKNRFLREATVRWSHSDNCYIAETALWDIVIGTGETEREAMAMLGDMLDEALEDLNAGTLAAESYPQGAPPPRPAKDSMTTRLESTVKLKLKAKAKELGISVGELIEQMARRTYGF